MTNVDSQDLSLNEDPYWAIKYIGRPWENGAQGPDKFDCWSFFRYVQLHERGIDVPVIDVDANNIKAVISNMIDHNERSNWKRAETPQEGDAVLMAHCKYPSHVGMWLDVDGGGVLHCVRGEGVVFSAPSSLKTSGWSRVEYFRHVGNA